jgi:hypothetical protein
MKVIRTPITRGVTALPPGEKSRAEIYEGGGTRTMIDALIMEKGGY